MKKLIFSILVIIPLLSSAQKTNYGLPPFNMEEIKNLKDSGSLDARGLRTGMWVEYKFDSTDIKNYVQGMDQGYNSYPLYDKVLVKSVGKYLGGRREGVWKFYKSYSTSKPFHWDLEEDIQYKNNLVSGKWKYYRTDGKIIAEQSFKDGYPNGIYKKYYPNGKLQTEIPYKNGYINGTKKNYNDKGVLIFSVKITNGHYHGPVRYYYSNGQLRLERIYQFGVVMKETKVLDRTGKPLEKGTLENGNGIIIFYNELCAKELVAQYKNGLQNGKATEYYPTGIIKREYSCVNDTVEGIEKIYNEKGILIMESTVKKGIYNGKRKFNYSNGKAWAVRIMKDGLIWNELNSIDTAGKPQDCGTFKDGSGIMKFYDDSCRLVEVSEYKNGLQNGLCKGYFPNGKVEYELYYRNDTILGIAKTYWPTGTLESENEIVDGKYNGIQKYYYPNGKLAQEKYMIRNNSWNIIQLNDTNGNPVDPGTFKDGSGVMKVYNDSGLLWKIYTYRNGMYDGPSTTYYPLSGKVRLQCTYVNDTMEGPLTTYYENGNVEEASIIHKGQTDGISNIYHDNGQLWTTREHIDGYYWNIKANYDKSGNPQDKGTLQNGNGTMISYDQSGKIVETLHIVYGEVQVN